MASLTIPNLILNGLAKIAALSDESFQELVSALENIPLKIRQHRIFDGWPLNLETLSEEDSQAIRDAITPLYMAIVAAQLPIDTYVEDVAQSLREARAGEQWAQSEETLAVFKERLLRLLRIDSLRLVAKAHDVLLEHAQTFSNARILSDVRPVYGDDVAESPRGAVIVHMLNLVYRSADERKEFVVALDTKDIQDLLDVLERAKKKTESLANVIAATGIPYIEVV